MNHFSLHRRGALAAAMAAFVPVPLLAQGKAGAAGRSPVVAQIFDTSSAEQDVAKDFLIGSRAAWQDVNSRGGLRGRPVQHLAVEVDGTPNSVRTAWATLRDNPAVVALSGTVSDPVASQLAALLRQEGQ